MCSQIFGRAALASFLYLSVYGNLGIFAQTGSTLTSHKKEDQETQSKVASAEEAFIFQDIDTKFDFQSDGTETDETDASIQVLSDAGVQRWGVLSFSYQNLSQTLNVNYVRVIKPTGIVIVTPPENIQEITSEISRVAPFYADQREKHVAVKGLAVGDRIEYSVSLRVNRPLIPGQFWTTYEFEHHEVVKKQTLEIAIPKNRSVKIKSRGPQYEVTEEGDRRIFRWNFSNNEVPKKDEPEKELWRQVHGQREPPDVLLSSFSSWDEVGRWYEGLERDRVEPTPEIRAKAAELTKDRPDDLEKAKAIYTYVSTNFRYIGIALGLGRYQPHRAVEVLENGYGDCKDKHTLLAALLTAAGFKVYPALIDSDRDIDADVPSPAQFDHLISVVVLNNREVWLDTTPGLAPFGFLVSTLRGKRALLITGNSPATLVTTPGDSDSQSFQSFDMHAKLDDSGTLTGDAQRQLSGSDLEVFLRAGFRSLPMPEWKDLVQRLSYASGFGGEVSDVTASSPEDLGRPFRFSYKYQRKNYSDWKNGRISPPLPVMLLPDIREGERTPTAPLWLGVPGEIRLHSSVELPKGYTLELPSNVELKEDFGEYEATYSMKEDTLITDRVLRFSVSEIAPSQYDKYKAFRKKVDDDRDLFVTISKTNESDKPMGAGSNEENLSSAMDKLRQAIWSLPPSSDPVAAQYESDARDALLRQDLEAGIQSLRAAVDKDPKFVRGWVLLSTLLGARFDQTGATDALRHAVAADPKQVISYKLLGFSLMASHKYQDAVSVWQELIRLAPEDHEGQANLGSALVALKKFNEAAAALESARKIMPNRVSLELELGSAYLGAKDFAKAQTAFAQALKLDSSPVVFNNIAYMLAEANTNLEIAKQYSENAVRAEEEASGKLEISNITASDLPHTQRLVTFWDTLGWIYFRLKNLPQAESYLRAAWVISQSASIGEHLGRVYEAEQRRRLALHTYQLAISSHATGQDLTDLKQDLKRLGSQADGLELANDLSQIRTFHLPRFVKGTASADFLVLFSPGKVQAKFLSGSESLKSAAKSIALKKLDLVLPTGSKARVVRRGMLGCYPYSGCSLVFLTPFSPFTMTPFQ